MKDHLNLNAAAQAGNWAEVHRKSENEGLKIAQNLPGDKDNTSLESNGTPGEIDDVVDARMPGFTMYEDSTIDEMDFDKAMEHVNFITKQAMNSEGRQLMSRAHHDISPQQVVNLLGAAV